MANMSIAEAERILKEEANSEKRQEAQRILVDAVSWEESAWHNFMLEHSGQHGLLRNGSGKPDLNNLVHDCAANKEMLFKHAKANSSDGSVSPASLERAFDACKDSLAPLPKAIDPAQKSGERVSQNGNDRNLFRDQPSRAALEYRNRQPEPPFTRTQLMELAGQVRGTPGDLPRFKAIVSKWGSPAINKILQSE